jgi:hypothetical protein
LQGPWWAAAGGATESSRGTTPPWEATPREEARGWASNRASRDTSRRLAWLRPSLAAGLGAGLLLSPNLWVSTRAYPLTPIWDAVPPLSYPADHALLGLFVAVVAGAGIAWGRAVGWLAAGALALAALLVLGDTSRLQPWFYQYSFMLLALCLYGWGRVGTTDTLNACRLIVVATYFWSGLQKANAGFFEVTYPWLVGPLTERLPDWASPALLSGAYAVPAVEAAIGIGLLTRRFRKPAVVGALLMHAFIMLCVGPWGNDHNTVVWPWNFAMSAFVLVLFWRARDEPSPSKILGPGRSLSLGFALRAAVLALFALMPLFSFFGLWDSYLSSSLYSGASKQGYVMEWDGSDWQGTGIGNLAVQELNTPAYPEERIFKSVFAQRWCEAEGPARTDRPEPVLRIDGRPAILSGERPSEFYGCDDIQ